MPLKGVYVMFIFNEHICCINCFYFSVSFRNGSTSWHVTVSKQRGHGTRREWVVQRQLGSLAARERQKETLVDWGQDGAPRRRKQRTGSHGQDGRGEGRSRGERQCLCPVWRSRVGSVYCGQEETSGKENQDHRDGKSKQTRWVSQERKRKQEATVMYLQIKSIFT